MNDDIRADVEAARELVAQWAVHPHDRVGCLVRLIGHCEALLRLNAALAERVAQAELLVERAQKREGAPQ